MGLDDFSLQSNNGKKYSLKDLKDIKLEDIAKNPKLQKFIKLFDLDGSGSIEVRNKNGKNEWQSIFTELKQAAVDDDLSNEEFGLYISKKMPNEDLELEDVNELLDIASGQGNVTQIGDMTITRMNGFVAIKIKPNTTILAKNVNENGQFSDDDFIEMKTVDSEGKEITVKREEFKTKEGTTQCIVVTRQDSKDESSTTIYGTSSYYMYEIFKGEESLKTMEFYRKGNNEYYVQYTQEGNTITHAKNGDTVDSLIQKFGFEDREEFDRLNPALKGKKYPNVADSIVVPGRYSAKDNKIVEQGTVYGEQYNYIKTVSEAERRKFKEEHLQKLDEDIFNKLNNLKGLELSNENIGLYFSLNSYPQKTQVYIFNIIEKLAKEGKTADEIKTYFLSAPNAPKLTREDGTKVNINLFNEFSIQMHDFVGTQADDTPQSVKGFIQDVIGLDITKGEGKELYDKLSKVGDPYVIMDINEMFSNIYHRTTKEYKDWHSKQVARLNSDGWKSDKSIKTTGEREYLKEYPPITKETALEMYRAVINKMTAKKGETVTTKYDKFIEDNRDVYLREFATLTLFSLHQSGAGNLQGTAAQKDILNPSKYLLKPVGSFYDKKGKEIYETMMADCYKGNKKFESILKCYTTGYKQAGVPFDKTKMKRCMEVLQNPKSTEAQKKKALEDAFGYQVVNAAQDLIGVADFVDNVTDMALMIYGTGLIGKGLGKAVSFASKASTATRATAVITNTAKGISWGERLTQIGLSATNFAIWEGARFTVNYYTNDIEEDFSYGSGLGQRMAGGAAFGTFAGAWGQFVTQPMLKWIFKTPAQEAVTKEATAFVSKQLKGSSKFTSKEVLGAFNAGQQKAMTSLGKEAVGFASELTGFSIYEIGQKLIVGNDAQIRQILQDSKKYKPEEIDDLLKKPEELKKALKEVGCNDDVIRELTEINVGDVALGQLKTLLSFKAVGQLVYMHRAGKLPPSALNFGKEKPLEFEPIKQNGKTMYKVKYPDGTTRTVADMNGVVALSNMHYQDVTLYKPIELVLVKDGKMELDEGITLQKNTEGYSVTFKDGTKIEAKDLKEVMGKAQAEYTIMGYETELAQKGKVELPDKQVITFDKENNLYKTTIEDNVGVEATSVKELLQSVQKKRICQSIEKSFTDDKKAVMLDESTVIVKQEDGTYRMIVIEDGFPKEYTGKSVEEVLDKSAGVKEGVTTESQEKVTPQGSDKEITRGDNTNSREKILEGDIKDTELTEVAPFARHLVPHSVTDPFTIIADNLDERANKVNFDLTKYEKTGFPLKYSRQEFTQRLKDLVNNMPIEAQREILKKFNIELNYTGDSFELRDIPKIPRDIKTPLEFAIKAEIERFTKENEIEIDNPEVKVFLDDFIKLAPEFLFIVGKKQHETQAYTVDVHTIKVLQNAIEHPEYKNLSAEDKMVLNTAILLHDIAKQFVDIKTPDDSHAEYGYNYAIKILDRFNLSSDIKQRIVKLIRNHEFFKTYNERYIPFKAEAERNEQERQDAEKYGYKFSPRNDYTYSFNCQVEYNAGQFLNISDFRLAKILTYSDLKSVNPDKTFTREEWNRETRENEPVEYQGFEKFVTGTHSDTEFKEYIDESLSYIEKELQKYDGGRIDDEFVYETELAETSLKLFGRTDFFASIGRKLSQNQPYAVHRSDFNMIIQARQTLLDAGVKEKDVAGLLRELIKYERDMFSPELTSEFIKAYLENKEFIDSHNINLGGSHRFDSRNAEMLKEEIAIIKEKESIAEIFKKYNVKDEWMQKRLVDSLYTSEYNREIGKSEPVFSKEAHVAMLELFDLKKFTPDEIYNIIYNSFSVKNNRGNFRNNGNEGSCFNRQIFDTILELSKEEPLENAIKDTHLCFVNATPESGWILAPEILSAIKDLNKMGINDKGFIWSTFDVTYKDGKNRYDQERIIKSITKNELYEKAIKYSKQGFDAREVNIIINSFEIENGKDIYSEQVQDKIANLVKLGVYQDYPSCSWSQKTLFDERSYEHSWSKIETRKFNETNYNFIVSMFNKGIPPEILDNMVYQSGCETYKAEKAAPDKMVETGKFSKAQVEAMVDFFKEIGFDKAPRSSTDDIYHDLAECFMDIVELTSEELEGMSVYNTCLDRMMPMSKMHNGMAPFRIVNKEKFNQALEYYKKGVSINNLKHLTETPELYKELKNEADLSFIKTENDADLVSTFWKMKDVKSINELSKQERIQFMNELMMHKSEIEGNNVSDKISILPKDSQGYSDMMKNIADSFGLNSEPYTQQKVSQINKSFSDISARLQTIKPSEIETDNSINQLINEITSFVPNLNKQNISSILLTLQRVVKNPEYQTLSESDKKLLNIAVIFSKVDSASNNPFDSAIDACVFAKQMGLSDTDAMKIFAIVKNSNLTETAMSTKRNVRTNKSRSYIHIVTDDIKETFETAAMELKDYNNFQMAKLLYTANENFVSPQMLQEYAPDLYKEFLNIRNSVKLENGEISKDAKAMQIMQNNPQYTDKLEEVKLKGREKYSLSRNLNKLLEEQIDEIKSCDVLLPQTNLSDFIAKQSPEWIQEHTQNVNGRNVLVIGSDEIPDFYMLSHTTQAFNILGKANATTNMSNFENFAMLFNDKTICLSYSGNGKIAVVGNVGLLIQTPNTSQYIARGTDISSVAKDIPTMISEYISHRSQIVQKARFQTKATKDYDRNFFASLIKEELAPGYRTLLDQKISLEEQIREYNSEKTNESLESLQQQLKDVKNQMRPIDKIYRMRIENLINKANGEVIDLEFIRNNDPELGNIYDKILNTINVEHRGNDGIMRTEYHNEVLGSNTKPVGLFVRGDKELFNLTDDYLKKAEEDVLPIVIYK